MLETIREYAFESLIAGDEQSATRSGPRGILSGSCGRGQSRTEARQIGCAGWRIATWRFDNFRVRSGTGCLRIRIWTGGIASLRSAVSILGICGKHLTEGRSPAGRLFLRMAGVERSRERARVSQFLGALATAQGDYPAAERFLATEPVSLQKNLADQSGHRCVPECSGDIGTGIAGDYSAAQSNFERRPCLLAVAAVRPVGKSRVVCTT